MAFPNPDHVKSEDPQWRPVASKPDVWVHDDKPDQEVEIIAYECGSCRDAAGQPVRRLTYHGVTHDPDRGYHAATPEEREEHATCHGCGDRMERR
jgi:hypothetical protein